jgi:hypothetical protein
VVGARQVEINSAQQNRNFTGWVSWDGRIVAVPK